MFAAHAEAARRQHPAVTGRRLLFESVRRMLSAQVYDVIDATAAALRLHRPASADEARRIYESALAPSAESMHNGLANDAPVASGTTTTGARPPWAAAKASRIGASLPATSQSCGRGSLRLRARAISWSLP